VQTCIYILKFFCDIREKIFLLGCTLYELYANLTGVRGGSRVPETRHQSHGKNMHLDLAIIMLRTPCLVL